VVIWELTGECSREASRASWVPKITLYVILDHPAFASVLDHLSIQKIVGRDQSWVGKPSSAPFPFGVHPPTKGVEDRVLVGGALVAEEDSKRPVIDPFGLLQEIIGFLLGDPPSDKGRDDLVHRIK